MDPEDLGVQVFLAEPFVHSIVGLRNPLERGVRGNSENLVWALAGELEGGHQVLDGTGLPFHDLGFLFCHAPEGPEAEGALDLGLRLEIAEQQQEVEAREELAFRNDARGDELFDQHRGGAHREEVAVAGVNHQVRRHFGIRRLDLDSGFLEVRKQGLGPMVHQVGEETDEVHRDQTRREVHALRLGRELDFWRQAREEAQTDLLLSFPKPLGGTGPGLAPREGLQEFLG